MRSYYHATFKDRLPSIRAHGLGGDPTAEANFDCAPGVYLAYSPVLAYGILLDDLLHGRLPPWLDPEKVGPAEYAESIVVIAVPGSRLRRDLLETDPQIKCVGFWRYLGVVPAADLPVLDVDAVAPDSVPKPAILMPAG